MCQAVLPEERRIPGGALHCVTRSVEPCRVKMISLIVRIVVFCVALALIISATIKFISQKYDSSRCGMTYMYEIPEYIPIKMKGVNASIFLSYHLYVYGEGSYAASLKQKKFHGIPVLFLPGNSGSYKQVRSLASVSLTKASRNQSLFHFNYFTVDFNEEYSAFYGGILDKQAEYVSICIKHILQLYATRANSPTSVIIIGHSMGGLVAQALFLLPNFNPTMVSVILTLATPHRAPVAEPDFYMADFYSRIHTFWMKERRRLLMHVNLVAVGGGKRDLMVKSNLIRSHGSQRSLHDISIVSTAIPEVWTSMDHLCIVWCNQLVLTIVRATFQLVDATTRQVSVDAFLRSKILRAAFIYGGRRAEKWSATMNESAIGSLSSWTSKASNWWRYTSSNASCQPPGLLVPVIEKLGLIIVTEGVDLDPMVVGCHLGIANSHEGGLKSCSRMTRSLPVRPLYMPLGRGFWKVFLCHPACHLDETHLLIKLPFIHDNVNVVAQVFDGLQHTVNVTVFDGIVNMMLIDVPSGSVFYEIGFPDLLDVVPAYTVTFRTSGSSCSAQVGISHFYVPWNLEDSFVSIRGKDSRRVIYLTSTKEMGKPVAGDYPRLRLYLRPECKLLVKVEVSLMGSLEQLLRYHIYFLPVFLAAALLRILSEQFASLAETGLCQSPWRSLSLSSVLSDVMVIHLLVTVMSWVSGIFMPAKLARLLPDWCSLWVLLPDRVFRIFVTAFFYIACAASACILTGLVSLIVLPVGKILSVLLNWFRLKEKPRSSSTSWLPIAVKIGLTLMMAIVAFQTCGVVSMLALQVLSSLRLLHSHIRLFQAEQTSDYLPTSIQCRFDVCYYLLYGLIFQLSCPAFVFWIKNLRFEQQLKPDPSFIPVLLVLMVTLVQRTTKINHMERKFCRQMATLQRFFSACILIFGPDHLYRVVWLLVIDAFVLGTWPSVYELMLGELRSSAGQRDRMRNAIQSQQPRVKTFRASAPMSGMESRLGRSSVHKC